MSLPQDARPSADLEATFRLGCVECDVEFFSILGGDGLEAAERGGPVYLDCPRCQHQRKCLVVAPDPSTLGRGGRP